MILHVGEISWISVLNRAKRINKRMIIAGSDDCFVAFSSIQKPGKYLPPVVAIDKRIAGLVIRLTGDGCELGFVRTQRPAIVLLVVIAWDNVYGNVETWKCDMRWRAANFRRHGMKWGRVVND